MTTDLSQAYDDWHGRLADDGGADAPWHVLVKRHLGDVGRLPVMEVACGRGGLARWLARQEPVCVVAADFSPRAVALASSGAAELPLHFEVADAQHLPHPDGAFDVVVSCETIEHLPRPDQGVRELARVLRPGGRLLLTTPNYLNAMGLYRAYRRLSGQPFTEVGQPLNRLTLLPRTLMWIQAAGLRPRVVDAAGHYLPVPGRAPVALRRLDGPKPVFRWLARHPLVVAVKPTR